MDRGSLAGKLRPIKHELGGRIHKWLLDRNIPPMPTASILPIDRTTDVLLLCSQLVPHFDADSYVKELAFAQELAARNRPFAVSADPSALFDKSVAWFLPNYLVSPRLWDYSRQVYEFAMGLERQGNRLFCSSAETMFWENKAHMHRRLADIGVPTPKTKILTRENWRSFEFDLEPVLIKEEHSSGSAGIHHFTRAAEALTFVDGYVFRGSESLILQEVVPGAMKDLRLTMVGDEMIESATYWRAKSAAALSSPQWTTTATTYDSVVDHGHIPESVVPVAAEYLRQLGIRTAGIDIMWVDDDVSGEPLLLELSPYYQPNPPKPKRYDGWTYKQYKAKPYVTEGYYFQQYLAMREIAGKIIDQKMY